MEDADFVWVFVGAGGKFPSAVFSEHEAAVTWISNHSVTGVLTKCPLNTGLYDWALKMNYFTPKQDDQRSPEFIGRFTCASLEHYHFEHGLMVTH
jgi:hypothetical protein